LRENDLIGKSITVGTVVLRAVNVIKRCVVPSYDVEGGPHTPGVQTYVVRERAREHHGRILLGYIGPARYSSATTLDNLG